MIRKHPCHALSTLFRRIETVLDAAPVFIRVEVAEEDIEGESLAQPVGRSVQVFSVGSNPAFCDRTGDHVR